MRIGIIGAGQLGQMLGFAARDLDLECRFVDPSDSPPAAACGEVIQRPFDDADALAELAATCDVVTYEFENVPVEALHRIDGLVPVFPPAAALRHAQDRLAEKQLFDELAIPLPGYRTIDTREDMEAAVDALGLPVVIKTRRLGYDGKGQFVIRERDDIDEAWKALGSNALIAEQWIGFDYEVSCIGARNVDGDIEIYPLSQNVHEGGILHTSKSPVDEPVLTGKAETYVRRAGARALCLRRRTTRERVRPARAQFRSLGDRRVGDESIREPPAGGHQPVARLDSECRPRWNGQPDWQDSRRRPDSRIGLPSRLWQGPSARPQTRPHHGNCRNRYRA